MTDVNKTSKKYKCPNCLKTVPIEEIWVGVCKECGKAGIWIDPAGGVHIDDDEPWRMYE